MLGRLEANLVLIKFARITCIVFSVRKSGNNKAFIAKSFCVCESLFTVCETQSCRVLGQKLVSAAFLYF